MYVGSSHGRWAHSVMEETKLKWCWVPGCSRWLWTHFSCDVSIFTMIFEPALNCNKRLIEVTHVSSWHQAKGQGTLTNLVSIRDLCLKLCWKQITAQRWVSQSLSNSQVSCDRLTGFVYDSCFYSVSLSHHWYLHSLEEMCLVIFYWVDLYQSIRGRLQERVPGVCQHCTLALARC